MNREYIESNQIIDRYLLGDLSQEEQEEFEEFYFHNQDIVGELELGEKMIDGFRAARDQGALNGIVTPKEEAGAGRRGGSFAVPYGMAASVLLAISLFYNVALYQETAVQSSTTDALETRLAQAFSPQGSKIEALERTRGVRPDPSRTITVSEAPQWFVLKFALEPEEAAYDDYTVSLIDGAGEIEWQESVTPNADDSLTINLHSSQMQARDYVVRVERLDESGEPIPVARYAFRVRVNES